MKQFFYISVCLLFFNCKPDCLDIYDKYAGGGQYYFQLEGRRSNDSQGNSIRSYPTTIVSQEVYNQYSIGDRYCKD